MAVSHYPSHYGNVAVSNGTGHTYTAASSTNAPSWATNVARTTAQGQLKIEGKNADILINEKSLGDFMSDVEKRLSILCPKPELLKKYESLQQAFDHYKTLEALLHDEPEKE